MSIFTSLSGSNIHMNYGYLSSFGEIAIFFSDAVARQHRIVPADLCISFSLLFPNLRYIQHNEYDLFVSKCQFNKLEHKILPCTPNKNDVFSQVRVQVDFGSTNQIILKSELFIRTS